MITKREIENAINTMNTGKAPGPDKITIDLLKDTGTIIHHKLANLYTTCLKDNKIPEDWNNAIIILLHKKGNTKDLTNYRHISLPNFIYKLLTSIITDIIGKILGENHPREQAGFRKGHSTIDNLHILNQRMEKTSEYNMPLLLAFVDYNKTFESVETAAVIISIKHNALAQSISTLFNTLYNNRK